MHGEKYDAVHYVKGAEFCGGLAGVSGQRGNQTDNGFPVYAKSMTNGRTL